MKNTDLYRGIGEADDKYIKSAQKSFERAKNKEKREKTGRIIRKVLSVAAAVIIIGGVWAVSYSVVLNSKNNPKNSPVTDVTETAAETKTTEAEDTPAPVSTSELPDETDAQTSAQTETEDSASDTNGVITTTVIGDDLFIGYIDVPGMAYTEALRLEEVGGYPFAYRDGQELTVRKNGKEIYGLKTAYNSHLIDNKELRDFFLSYLDENRSLYDEFMAEILSQSIEEFSAGYEIRTALNRPASLGRLTYYNYIDVIFTMYLDNKYAVVYKTADEQISDFVENISNHEFIYKDGYLMRIFDGSNVKVLSELALKLKSGEITALHREYTEFYHSYYKEARTGKELTEAFEEYFKTGKPATKNGYTVKYAVNIEGAYIGNVDKDGEPLAGNVRFEVVDGLPFSYPVYSQGFTVVRNNDYAIGLKTALDDRLINDEELELFFAEYANYTNFDGYDIIVKSLYEYLDGAMERNSKDGTEKKKLDCYRYINVYYCIKLSDDKYAALYSVLGEMRSDFYESAENIVIEDRIFTFMYKNGIYLRIVDEKGIFQLTSRILTGSPDDLLTSSEVIKLHDSYEKYINGDPATIKEAFDAFIQTGEGYYGDSRVYYAYKAADSDTYFGIFVPGDLEEWNETVAGYTFDHPNGNKFIVIKNKSMTEGLTEAYNQGEISAQTVREFYEAYTGYEQSRADNVNRRSAAKSMTKALEKYLSECKQFLTLDASLSVPLNQSGGLYGSYYVKSCFTISDENGAKYFAFISPHDEDHKNEPWSEEIEGITFNYPTDEKLTVIYDRTAYFSLSEAYDAGVVTKQDLIMVKEYLFN